MRPSHRLLAGLCAGILSLSAQAAIHFSFDDGEQSWSVINGGNLTWQASGGNPNGYLEISDANDGDFLVNAPVSSLGDWSAYLNGTLRFDAKNIDGATADWGGFGLVTITGTAGSVSLDIVPGAEPVPGAGWKTYSVVLGTAAWGANLPAILANVTQFTIEPEFHAGQPELVGVDNISISAVPEPEAFALLLAGLGVVGWTTRGRHRR